MLQSDEDPAASQSLYGMVRAYAEALAVPLVHFRCVLGFGGGCSALMQHYTGNIDRQNIYTATFDPASEAGAPGTIDRLYPSGRLPYPDDFFDNILVPSALLHLPEVAHLHWAGELARVARPGCVLTVALRPRDSIAAAVAAEPMPLAGPGPTTRAPDLERAYDRGEFVELPANPAGEAVVPVAYLRRRWRPPFELRDTIEDPARFASVIVFLQHA